jgi:hypothetical protein
MWAVPDAVILGGMPSHAMVLGPKGRSLVRRRATAIFSAVLAMLLVWTAAAPALAEEEPVSADAEVLVLQAVALVANDAGTERISEAIRAALEAPVQEGVDIAMVQQALTAVDGLGEGASAARERAGMLQAQRLPQGAIGVPASVAPNMATGDETGTTVVLDEFQPARGIGDGGDLALLLVALAAIVAGLFLARRLRPTHSIHALRQGMHVSRDSSISGREGA